MSFIFDATGLVGSGLLRCVYFYIPQLRDNFKRELEKMNNTHKEDSEYHEIFSELIEGYNRELKYENEKFFI